MTLEDRSTGMVIDSAISTVKASKLSLITQHLITPNTSSHIQKGESSCVWNENLFLYWRNLSQAVIAVQVFDKDIFKEDDLIGIGEIPIEFLQVLDITEYSMSMLETV